MSNPSSSDFVFTQTMFEFWKAAKIPTRHEKQPGKIEGAWGTAYQSVISFLGTGGILVLLGKRGSGKTQLGIEAIRETCKLERSGFYIKAMDIFLRLRCAMKDEEKSEESEIKALSKFPLLVIDALEVRGESEWEDRVLNHLIDLRYDACRDTILISNQTREEFGKSIGPSVISRVHETGNVIECEWDSFRENGK